MDPWIFNVILNEEIHEIIAQNTLRIRRALRDASDPFHLPITKFKKMFRLSPEVALLFFRIIEPMLQEPQRTTSIPKHLKFLTALYFFSQGSYQTNIGRDYNLGLSQPAVSRCIRLVSNVIAEMLLNEYVKFPISNEDVERVKAGFVEKFNFQNILGCVDGSHISIIQPPENDAIRPGIAYLNRKNFYSINTQLICDSDMRILAVNARFPGSTHDSAIWQMSNVKRHLQTWFLAGHRTGYLLGDSGYPLEPWLMTPILDVPENTPEGRYTHAHCSTRNIIERCIGLLKSRFKCLLRHRSLHYHPVVAGKIIYSCVVLHNICINANLDFEGEIINDEIDLLEEVDNDLPPNILRIARDIQQNVVEQFA